MTKPEQLLKLAQIVEPDKEWFIHLNHVIYQVFQGGYKRYEPWEDSPKGDAQLMQVVFALYKKIGEGLVGDFEQAAIEIALENQDKEAIINLAIEVLL